MLRKIIAVLGRTKCVRRARTSVAQRLRTTVTLSRVDNQRESDLNTIKDAIKSFCKKLVDDKVSDLDFKDFSKLYVNFVTKFDDIRSAKSEISVFLKLCGVLITKH